jgi:hypothetical protein
MFHLIKLLKQFVAPETDRQMPLNSLNKLSSAGMSGCYILPNGPAGLERDSEGVGGELNRVAEETMKAADCPLIYRVSVRRCSSSRISRLSSLPTLDLGSMSLNSIY